jgi:hypothetical protein
LRGEFVSTDAEKTKSFVRRTREEVGLAKLKIAELPKDKFRGKFGFTIDNETDTPTTREEATHEKKYCYLIWFDSLYSLLSGVCKGNS